MGVLNENNMRLCKCPIELPKDEECDATTADSSTTTGQITHPNLLKN
jgi:hypothetical protein